MACEAWCVERASGSPRNVSIRRIVSSHKRFCCQSNCGMLLVGFLVCGWLWTKLYFRREILKHVGNGFPLRAFALEPAVCRVILSKHELLTWLNTVRSESVQWNECAKDCSKAPSDQSTLGYIFDPFQTMWLLLVPVKLSTGKRYCQQRSRSSLHWQACSSMLLTHLFYSAPPLLTPSDLPFPGFQNPWDTSSVSVHVALNLKPPAFLSASYFSESFMWT